MEISPVGYLVRGLRSPIGKFGGGLAPLRATELASAVAKTLFARNQLDPGVVDLVIAGMVLQDMSESNPARIVAKRSGIPDTVPAYTINMQCCSGMIALIQAVQQVAIGSSNCVMVIGLESMSNAPHMVAGARWGLRLAGTELQDSLKECFFAGSKMWGDPMAMIDVAENHAKVDRINRQAMDEYAVVSHTRASEAIKGGRFDQELVKIEVPGGKGKIKLVDIDEHPRPDISLDKLSVLPTVRNNGVITAGNSAGINDGAAVALVCNEKGLAQLSLKPMAKIPLEATSIVGCDPSLMGYSCVFALNKALQNTNSEAGKLDLIECNEGFAVQILACERAGKWSRSRLNVDGGSVGLGHPVGMSGLRIAIHLAHALEQRDLKRGGATIPAGSGLGAALLMERA